MKRTLAFCLPGEAIGAATLVTGQIGGRPNPNGWQLCDGDCPSPPPCYNGTNGVLQQREVCAIWQQLGWCKEARVIRYNCVHNPNDPNSNAIADYIQVSEYMGSSCDIPSMQCQGGG